MPSVTLGLPLAFMVLLGAPARKPTLGPEELEHKREGGYFTGLPFVNSDPDKGFGFGGRVFYYDNGDRDDPYFAYTPYFHRVFVQYFRTTNGFQSHAVKYDAPYIADTLFRVRSALAYERDISANYFGVGSATLEPLRREGQPLAFENLDDYRENNRRIIAGRTFARYNSVDVLRPRWNLYLERDYFGGVVRPQVGFQIAKAFVRDYTGRTVEVDGTEATNGATKLAQDAEAGEVLGFDGGWDNTVKLGVAYDTRDFEPDPNRGVFADLTLEASNSAWGANHDFTRANTAVRHYFSPVSDTTDLVLATRALYQVQWGDVPFYEMSSLAFTHGNDIGLGGLRTIRGFAELRFIGKVMALANAELRWTFLRHGFLGQDLGYMFAPFVDTGRVFDAPSETTLRNWQTGYGAGLRLIWNQATIIALDYGRSREGTGIYANFGLIY